MRRTVSVTTVVVALLLSAVAAQQPVPAPRPVWQWAYPGILAHERRPGVWFATHEQVARAAAEQLKR